jgi:hypothetical protein
VKVNRHTGRWYVEARAMRARAKTILNSCPDPAPMLDDFERHCMSLLKRAQTQSDRVLIIRQPWFDAVFSPKEAAQMWHGGRGQVWREEVTTFYSFDVVSDLMRALSQRTDEIARRCNIEQLDLMTVLEPSLDTYYDCFHFAPAGSRTVAEAVAAAVLRRPLPVRMNHAPVVTPPGPCVALQEF